MHSGRLFHFCLAADNETAFDLTHYSTVLLIYTPWKHKTLGFLFSSGIDKQHRVAMG